MSSSLSNSSAISFDSLGLCDELLKAVAEQGYTQPSAIQSEAIVEVLKKRDVMAVARTGTGKTAGFTLPMVQLLSASSEGSDSNEGNDGQIRPLRGLVITPTRELAAQVAQSVENYAKFTNVQSYAVFGGVRIEPQLAKLKEGLDILVATPGRLIDLYNQNAINFEHLEILVLDEADRMLDLGFIDDIEHIQSLLPKRVPKREPKDGSKNVQTLMFSATFSQDIKSLAKGMLDNPKLIEVTQANSTVDSVKQQFYSVDQARKSAVLVYLIKKHRWQQVLVFSRTKQGADNLVVELENAGISAASIHANRTQHARTQALDGFKGGKIAVLVATDIASRGIDVNQLACVVNFDLPYIAEDYVHRIGRTGRAGQSGLAISLFSEDELKQLQSIERLVGVKFESEIIPGFEPSQNQNKSQSKGKKSAKRKVDDDDYGHFEADPKATGRGKPGSKGKSKGRGSRGGKASKPNSNDWKKMWP